MTGTILGSYRFDRFKGARTPRTRRAADRVADAAGAGRASPRRRRRRASTPRRRTAPATCRARRPTSPRPSFLADARRGDRRRRTRPSASTCSAPSRSPPRAWAAWSPSAGAAASRPRLIVLRYAGGGSGPTLGLVGKGVTFDTGGISLKPGAGMHEMKYDMSGAAAVLEAVAAIAELGLAVDLVAVVPSTENMPSGTAIKPGDVITQYNGMTVEVNNTDAEGRLILADALAYAVELGAERMVDLATLTGAVVIALGSTYAAVIANDDELAAAVARAGEESGELTWRLPLHPEFKALMKGTVADLSNLASKRKAGTITAASFLEEFVGETPWAHIDIAGTAWEVGREYTGNDASGFGVRLLVELAPPPGRLGLPAEDHAGRRAGGEQLAAVGGGQGRLRGRLFAAAVEDGRLAEDAAGVAGDRAHVLGLEPERGVADAGGQGRVDGAAEGRVEQGRGVAAVDDADRVVVLLPRFALEDDPPLLQLDRPQPHRHRDRRRRHLAGDDRASCTPSRSSSPRRPRSPPGPARPGCGCASVSGLEAAKASATSAAVAVGGDDDAVGAHRPPPAAAGPRCRDRRAPPR